MSFYTTIALIDPLNNLLDSTVAYDQSKFHRGVWFWIFPDGLDFRGDIAGHHSQILGLPRNKIASYLSPLTKILLNLNLDAY